jgi:hypothetical protein
MFTILVQTSKTGDLGPYRHQAFCNERVPWFSAVIKRLIRRRDGGLRRDHPCMQHPTDGSESVHRVGSPEATPGYPHESHHLPLKLFESEQIECVLQNATIAPVVLGSAEDDGIPPTHVGPEPVHVFRIMHLLFLPPAEGQFVGSEVE